ncbi:MAG: asparagine synthase (glutamine-hydrolyzing), partial [Nitrospinaceae bacterium]
MCGLAGIWSRNGSQALSENILAAMAQAIEHRGPDDHGVWLDEQTGVGLAHRRLSILDLSPHGHQPMLSPSGRYVIAYNGEIYNFQQLRARLDAEGQSPRWRGGSDTEVILAAIDAWGLEQAVRRFIGMFAFALWDRTERLLYLVRDRLGIKPLYYGWQGRSFFFGSELKAIKAHPDFKGEVDRGSLGLLLRHNYIPAPHSIYKGIHKVLPGHILTLKAGNSGEEPRSQAYWSALEAAEQGVSDPFAGSDEEAADGLDAILRDAIKLRMIADVPLGAFLSGGIDSSTVVALMQAQSDRPVKTFSIGFHEKGYNEAEDAKKIARHLGTDHTELYVTPEEAMAVIPRLPALYDEPFSDSSQIPTFLVSELARKSVTVSLSGDGGDELFCGYPRYNLGDSVWNKMCRVPRPIRNLAAGAMSSVSVKAWDALFYPLGLVLSSKKVRVNPGDKLHTLAKILRTESPEAFYRWLVSHWKDPAQLVGAAEPPTFLSNGNVRSRLPGFLEKVMYLDTVTYLPDDILTKVDRASMGVSLEARVPLIDHRVLEFAWRLPLQMKFRGQENKWLLRKVL